MRLVCALCLIALLLEVVPQAADGQSRDHGLTKIWIGAGFGLGSVGWSLSGNGTADFGGWLLSVRGTGNHPLGTSRTGLTDAGVLIGKVLREVHRAGTGLVTVAAGVGPVWRSVPLAPDGVYGDVAKRVTIGIPVEIQSCGTFLPGIGGIGACAYGFVNLNPERPFGGVAFSLILGKLR
jgi:hypothetical protein